VAVTVMISDAGHPTIRLRIAELVVRGTTRRDGMSLVEQFEEQLGRRLGHARDRGEPFTADRIADIVAASLAGRLERNQ